LIGVIENDPIGKLPPTNDTVFSNTEEGLSVRLDVVRTRRLNNEQTEPLAKLPTNKCGKLFSAPEKPFFEQG
jgi:hypothetical protein